MLIRFIQPKIEKKILAVLPSSNTIFQKMLGGFTSTLDQERRLICHLEIVSGKDSRRSLDEQVRHVLNENRTFDLIFSPGRGATRIVRDVRQEKNLKTPQVFCATPIEVITGPNQKQNLNITGIASPIREYSTQINHLLNLVETHPKKVIVLSTETVIEEEVVNIINELKKRNIEIMKVKIDHLQQDPFRALLGISREEIDLIVIPRDAFLVSIMPNLAEFCNYKKIPLYTSDVESVLYGAAFGFGFPEELHGKMAANRALFTVFKKAEEGAPPITSLENDYQSFLMLNIEGIKKQNLKLRLTPEEIRANKVARVIPYTLYQ